MPFPLTSAPSANQVGNAIEDLGLAGLLGGNLFGRLALHPSVTEIADPAERGKVVNAAWRRYGTVNTIALAAVAAGWITARSDRAADARLSDDARRLAQAKDALLGVVALCGLASGAQGVAFARTAPGGAVPLRDGDHVAPQASDEAQRAKRRLNALGLATLTAEAALVAVDAALEEASSRPAPARRLIPRLRRR